MAHVGNLSRKQTQDALQAVLAGLAPFRGQVIPDLKAKMLNWLIAATGYNHPSFQFWNERDWPFIKDPAFEANNSNGSKSTTFFNYVKNQYPDYVPGYSLTYDRPTNLWSSADSIAVMSSEMHMLFDDQVVPTVLHFDDRLSRLPLDLLQDGLVWVPTKTIRFLLSRRLLGILDSWQNLHNRLGASSNVRKDFGWKGVMDAYKAMDKECQRLGGGFSVSADEADPASRYLWALYQDRSKNPAAPAPAFPPAITSLITTLGRLG